MEFPLFGMRHKTVAPSGISPSVPVATSAAIFTFASVALNEQLDNNLALITSVTSFQSLLC